MAQPRSSLAMLRSPCVTNTITGKHSPAPSPCRAGTRPGAAPTACCSGPRDRRPSRRARSCRRTKGRQPSQVRWAQGRLGLSEARAPSHPGTRPAGATCKHESRPREPSRRWPSRAPAPVPRPTPPLRCEDTSSLVHNNCSHREAPAMGIVTQPTPATTARTSRQLELLLLDPQPLGTPPHVTLTQLPALLVLQKWRRVDT